MTDTLEKLRSVREKLYDGWYGIALSELDTIIAQFTEGDASTRKDETALDSVPKGWDNSQAPATSPTKQPAQYVVEAVASVMFSEMQRHQCIREKQWSECSSKDLYIHTSKAVIAAYEKQNGETMKAALEKSAEILANFKGCEAEDDGTLKRKLEEWQACYAMLFRQMNDLVQQRGGGV